MLSICFSTCIKFSKRISSARCSGFHDGSTGSVEREVLLVCAMDAAKDGRVATNFAAGYLRVRFV